MLRNFHHLGWSLAALVLLPYAISYSSLVLYALNPNSTSMISGSLEKSHVSPQWKLELEHVIEAWRVLLGFSKNLTESVFYEYFACGFESQGSGSWSPSFAWWSCMFPGRCLYSEVVSDESRYMYCGDHNISFAWRWCDRFPGRCLYFRSSFQMKVDTDMVAIM